MSDAALPLPPEPPAAKVAVGFAGAQIGGGVGMGNIAGGDQIQYEGVPFDQVAQLLARFLDKQPQVQELLVDAIETIQAGMQDTNAGMRAADQRLHRVTLILVWIAGALTGLTLVLTILLAVVLSTLFTVLQPHLIAGAL